MNTACMQVLALLIAGASSFLLSPSSFLVRIGSSVCFHRQARNICAKIPKGNDSNIQVQFISSVSTRLIVEKSSPRYIHHKMAPPSIKGSTTLATLLMMFFISMPTKVRIIIDTCQRKLTFLAFFYYFLGCVR